MYNCAPEVRVKSYHDARRRFLIIHVKEKQCFLNAEDKTYVDEAKQRFIRQLSLGSNKYSTHFEFVDRNLAVEGPYVIDRKTLPKAFCLGGCPGNSRT